MQMQLFPINRGRNLFRLLFCLLGCKLTELVKKTAIINQQTVVPHCVYAKGVKQKLHNAVLKNEWLEKVEVVLC